jgi:hypothetical protein
MSVSLSRLSRHDAGSGAVETSVHAGCEQRGGAPVAGPAAAYLSGSKICKNGVDSLIAQPGHRNEGALHG